MAGRRPQRIPSKARSAATNLADPQVSRAVDEVRAAANQALARRTSDIVTGVSLVVGQNVVQHNLGRAPVFVAVMLTAAGGSWSVHGGLVSADNPHPDRQVLIDVAGVAQPNAAVFVS
jgi:hypothetical protein